MSAGDVGTHINMLERELQRLKCGLPPEDVVMFVNDIYPFPLLSPSLFKSTVLYIYSVSQ